MMSLLKSFAALSLTAGLLMTLLPEGTMRRTAGMVVGLLMLLCWMDGVSQLLETAGFSLPEVAAPDTLLCPTGASLEQAAQEAAGALYPALEALQ